MKMINKRTLAFLAVIALCVHLGVVLVIFTVGSSHGRSIEEIVAVIPSALDVKYFSLNFTLIFLYLFFGGRILKGNHIVVPILAALMLILNIYMIAQSFISIFNSMFWASLLVYFFFASGPTRT
jgi:hypothetical protein